jgi:hypothetical protein
VTALVAQAQGNMGWEECGNTLAAAVVGLHGRQAAPGHGGSANRHTDVRGSKPQVGYSQEESV